MSTTTIRPRQSYKDQMARMMGAPTAAPAAATVDLTQALASLASGTLGSLTGFRDYQRLECVATELLAFYAAERARHPEWTQWQKVWDAYWAQHQASWQTPAPAAPAPTVAQVLDTPAPAAPPAKVGSKSTPAGLRCQVDRGPFGLAVAAVARAADPRSHLPILGHVLLRAEGGALCLRTTDLDLHAEYTVAARVTGPGMLAVPVKALREALKRCNALDLELEVVGTALRLRCDKTEITLQGLPGQDFPALPKVPATLSPVDAGSLRAMLEAVLPAVSRDDTRPYLCGVYLATEGRALRMVATDGHRMHLTAAEPGLVLQKPVVLPRAFAEALARELKQGQAEVGVEGPHAFCALPRGLRLWGRLGEHPFPQWEQVVPKHGPAARRIGVAQRPLAEALERAIKVVGKDQAVTLRVGAGELCVLSKSGSGDLCRECVDGQYDGPALAFCLKASYLRDALAACEGGEVVLALCPESQPVTVKTQSGPITLPKYAHEPLLVSGQGSTEVVLMPCAMTPEGEEAAPVAVAAEPEPAPAAARGPVYAFTPGPGGEPTGPTVYGERVRQQPGLTVLRVVRRDEREEELEVRSGEGELVQHTGSAWELPDLNEKALAAWEDAQAEEQDEDGDEAEPDGVLARCQEFAAALSEARRKHGEQWAAARAAQDVVHLHTAAVSAAWPLRLCVLEVDGALEVRPSAPDAARRGVTEPMRLPKSLPLREALGRLVALIETCHLHLADQAPAPQPAPAKPAAPPLLTRCQEIALALSELRSKQQEVWTAQPCESVREYVELRASSPAGELVLLCELDKGRLHVRGHYGRDLAEHVPERTKRASDAMSAGLERTDSSIASDISGRCISGYLCNLATARERKAAHEQKVAAHTAAAERLAAILHCPIDAGRRQDLAWGRGIRLYARGEKAPLSSLTAEVDGADSVSLAIRTGGAQAVDLAEALIRAAQGEAAQPAADAGTALALQAELATVQGELATARDALDLAQKQAAAASAAQQDLVLRHEAQARELAQARQDLDAAKATLGREIAALRQERDRLQAELAARPVMAKPAPAPVERRVAELEDEIAGLRQEVDSLRGEVASLKTTPAPSEAPAAAPQAPAELPPGAKTTPTGIILAPVPMPQPEQAPPASYVCLCGHECRDAEHLAKHTACCLYIRSHGIAGPGRCTCGADFTEHGPEIAARKLGNHIKHYTAPRAGQPTPAAPRSEAPPRREAQRGTPPHAPVRGSETDCTCGAVCRDAAHLGRHMSYFNEREAERQARGA